MSSLIKKECDECGLMRRKLTRFKGVDLCRFCLRKETLLMPRRGYPVISVEKALSREYVIKPKMARGNLVSGHITIILPTIMVGKKVKLVEVKDE